MNANARTTTTTTPRPGAARRRVPQAPWALSVMSAVLMAVVSVAGLAWPHLYRDDEAWIRAAWFGNDLVTLFVALPLLVTGLVLVRRGSLRGELLWYAMLGYAVYNYAYYLFGARMNALFPAYVLLFVLPAIALVMAVSRFDVGRIRLATRTAVPVRAVAGYMGLTGIGLTTAWVAQWAAFVFRGVVPDIGEDAFQLVATLDLSMMVPYFALGAVLLWMLRPWGYVLGAIMIVKGATYTLVLTSTSTVAHLRGIESVAAQIPVWAAWTAAGVIAGVTLFAAVRESEPGQRKAAALTL